VRWQQRRHEARDREEPAGEERERPDLAVRKAVETPCPLLLDDALLVRIEQNGAW